MKIQTDQLTALRQIAEQTQDSRESSDAFASLLAKQVGETQSAQTAQAAGLTAPPLGSLAGVDVSGIQVADSSGGSGQFTEQERAVMQDMDTLLAKWESYADKLAAGSEEGSLKQAYGVLENIETGVKRLKEELPSDANAGLGSLVNELEVMTATEKIKFNRGDYLA